MADKKEQVPEIVDEHGNQLFGQKVAEPDTPETMAVVQRGNSPAELIALGIEKGSDLKQLGEALELQIKFEQNEALKLYNVAIGLANKNKPEILKKKLVEYENKDGTVTTYRHADLADINEIISKWLSEFGLHMTWRTNQTDGKIHVEARITHDAGHYEKTELQSAPDASGGKNPIQAIGSAVEYLKRYTALAISGLAAKGMDDDGQGAHTQFIDEDQVKGIFKDIKLLKLSASGETTYVNDLLKWLNVDTFDELTPAGLKKCKSGLLAERKRREHA